uniref:Uncharacterized protein n=1 Tax=Clandestinovirus TaxID=2831644 RepID=A0A8F8PMQ6_9VIRU|nr:hypothetical protein KOM_12_487 [Clandestinovirus]
MAEQILNFLTDTALKMNGQHPILVLSGEVDFWAQKPEEVRFVAHQDNGLIVKPGDRQITSQSLEVLLNASATKKPDMMASLILSKYPIGELQRLHQENLLTPEQLAEDIKPVCVIAWAKLNTKPEVKDTKVASPEKEQKIEEPIKLKDAQSPPKTDKVEPKKVEEQPVEPVKASEPEPKMETEKKGDIVQEEPKASITEEKAPEPVQEKAVTKVEPAPVVEKEPVKVQSPVKVAPKPQVPVIVYQPKPVTPKVAVRQVQAAPSGTTMIRNPNVNIQQVRPPTQQQAAPKPQAAPEPQPVAQKPAVVQKPKDTISVLGYEVSTPAALMMGTFGLIGGCTALYFLTRNKGGHLPPASATPALPGPSMTPQFNLNSI